IGANNIDLSIFKNNKLIYFSVLPFGSANITNDIAVKLNCGTKTAERIKREIESLLDVEKTNKKKVELTQGKNEWEENLIFSPKDIYNNVILARLQEMLEQVDLEIGKAIKKELLPAGAVIVGGGAKLFDIVNIAKKKLRLGVEIGLPKSFSLINENPGAVTVCGLALMKHQDKGQSGKFATSIKMIEGNIKKSLKGAIERIKNLKQ
ncbi:MAG: rod shape-determining protein, partial [Methanosarcinaceae archaeon]|nr:rod shape-determining protein [Methanosarcinaceae archaeon]